MSDPLVAPSGSRATGRDVRAAHPGRRIALVAALVTLVVAVPTAAQDADRPEVAAAAECRAARTPGTTGVTGVARDSATGVALPEARVTLSWDRGAEATLGEASTRTNDAGWYFLCPVPTGVPVTTSTTFPRRRAQGVVTLPEGRELVRLDFVLTGEDAPDDERPSRITLLETGLATESATLTGSVRDQATGAPLVGAQVSVPDLEIGTVTEPGGGFRLGGLPAGEHVLKVEHLGYQPAEETFPGGADHTAVAWLAPRAIAMDALEVRARSREAEAARASGASRYRVERSDFEDRPAATLVEVLRSEVPGLRTGRDRRSCPTLVTRHGDALIVVDGVPFRDGCILNELDPVVIESVEVLSTVAASTRWGSLGGNGVVEITTRKE